MAVVSPPAPGFIIEARAMPVHTAIWPVTTNNNIVRPPTLPRFLRSPIAAMPDTREKKISGTTSILLALMKKSPIHLIDSASGPQMKPVIIPNISAPITRCQSGILNQKDSILRIPQFLFGLLPLHRYRRNFISIYRARTHTATIYRMRLHRQADGQTCGHAHSESHRNTGLEEISEAIITRRIYKRIGLVSDGRCKAGRGGEHNRNHQWPGVDAQIPGKRDNDRRHDHSHRVIGHDFSHQHG